MLKKISFAIILCTITVSCSKEQPTNRNDLGELPSIGLAGQKVVSSVGFSHDANKLIVKNSFTGKKEKACGKTNTGSDQKNQCKVIIPETEENKEFLDLLAKVNAFNKKIAITRNGKTQRVQPNFVTMISYEGSCGSLINSGGDQIESQVDCFSSEAQTCAEWVSFGWNFVKDYPPCNKYYD